MGDLNHRVELRRKAYGDGRLGELSIFAGGFINFGYWDGIPLDGELTVEQRIASQEALYDEVLRTLHVKDHRILEVGCGQGMGARRALHHDPALVRGVDLMPEQVERSRRANTDPRLEFAQGSASDLPFPDASFDGLLSVEAAQHFEDIPGFAAESARVLAPNGRFAVTTFFTRTDDAGTHLAELLETFESGLDLPHRIDGFTEALTAAGFTEVTTRSVGEHVWPGFDKWIAQGEFADSWGRNWIPAVERGLVDYYLVTARKPAGSGV